MANSGKGYDSGATGGGHTEADLALMIALTLKFCAQNRGLQVVMTRQSHDEVAPLALRMSRMEKAGATHFLAIHLNSSGNPFASGTETFYRDEADRKFAQIVHGALCQVLGRKDRGLKTEDKSPRKRLAVFGFHGPACLAEVGFISNRTDRDLLLRRDIRIAVCDLIVARIIAAYS